jgi:hypothetical protein
MATTDCSICYDEISASTGKMEMAGCSHAFHYRCITSWFKRQEAEEAGESCPCCRNQPGELGRLPGPQEASEVTDDDETLSYSAEDDEDEPEVLRGAVSIEQAAARERAVHRFGILRATLTEEALKAYAATRIAAAMRGSIARTSLWMANEYYPRKVQTTHKLLCEQLTALNGIRQQMRKAKLQRAQWTQRAMLGLTTYSRLAACTIQTWWRPLMQRIRSERLKEEQMVSNILEKGAKMVVTWRRLDGHRWTRIILNPEERDAETFNMAIHALPPQSLAFEMAMSVIKIQSVWRGHMVRSISRRAPLQ